MAIFIVCENIIQGVRRDNYIFTTDQNGFVFSDIGEIIKDKFVVKKDEKIIIDVLIDELKDAWQRTMRW